MRFCHVEEAPVCASRSLSYQHTLTHLRLFRFTRLMVQVALLQVAGVTILPGLVCVRVRKYASNWCANERDK